MFKKNSWIVALLLALSLTAFLFTGCVNPLKVVEDTETYEEYPLDKGYNAWAGQVYQKGWAIGGIKFQGKGDAIVVAKDLGYDIEMFQKATKLKIEMPDASYPRSGVDIIWGGEDASGDSGKAGGMWNQQPIAGGSGDIDTTFAKKDGNVLIIDLTKALKNYSAYTKAAKLKIVMQVNAPSYGDVEGLVQKAYLMIPSTPPPFKSITRMTLANDYMYYTSQGFQLDGKFVPEDATNQAVSWQIVGWTPTLLSVDSTAALTRTLPILDPFSQTSIESYNKKKKDLLATIGYLKESYVVDDSVYPTTTAIRDVPGTLIVPEASTLSDGTTPAGGFNSIGSVRVRAIVKDGRRQKDGTSVDFEFDYNVQIRDPLPLTFKFITSGSAPTETPFVIPSVAAGGSQTTKEWGAVDNGGVKGGWMEVLAASNTTPAPPAGTYDTYTITLGGGYANSHHYIKIDLGTYKLSDFKGMKIHYKAKTGDSNIVGKTFRLRGNTTVPPRKYSEAGPYVSTIKYFADAKNADDGGPNKYYGDGKEADIDFKFFKDEGQVFNKRTLNADKTVATYADMPDTQSINSVNVDFSALKNASVVYLWFVPWSEERKSGEQTKFEISDIKIYKND